MHPTVQYTSKMIRGDYMVRLLAQLSTQYSHRPANNHLRLFVFQ